MAEKRRTRKAQEVAEKPVEDLDKEILVEEKEAPEKASPAPKTGIVLPSLLNMRTGAGKEFPPYTAFESRSNRGDCRDRGKVVQGQGL